MRIIQIFTLLTLNVLVACIGTKKSAVSTEIPSEETSLRQEEEQKEEDTVKVSVIKQPDMKKNIADAKAISGVSDVDGCHVVATIISIDQSLDSNNPESPCGRVQCGALIRIDKIVKMGQQCAPYIVPGAEKKAYFKITLGNTLTLFPNMQRHFTGLGVNDTFSTSFVAIADYNEEEYQIVIYSYAKVK